MDVEPAAAGKTAPALVVEALSHKFGARVALDDVSFAIAPGQFTILLGQNGAGKTTLFSLVTRLYNNRGGAIRVFGYDVRSQSLEALKRIGVVFQQRTLDLDLTVRQNLRYHAALHGMPGGLVRERIEIELARLELSERAGDKVRQLSGGQLRRVEIARALLHQPQLLLFDEATVGLDIGSRQGILDHMRALVREEGLALLWATHLIDEVAPDNRVVVLHEGKVLANDTAEEIVRQVGARDIRDAFTQLTTAASS
jgi:ABC-2 type transport system ATP-binding protein